MKPLKINPRSVQVVRVKVHRIYPLVAKRVPGTSVWVLVLDKKRTYSVRSFVGPAGTMVREIMDCLSLSPLYTNVLKRRPVGKNPSRSECFRCGLHLIEEMKRHNVVVILALGQTAFNFLNGQSNLSVNDIHGLPIPMNRFGMDLVVVGTHDPGNILRRGGLLNRIGEEWIQDLEEFAVHARKV